MTTVLDLTPLTKINSEKFYQLCLSNPDVSLELSKNGELIIVSPVGGESGNREANLIADLINWNRQTRLGVVFSSSTIFNLPRGGNRSPDAAWVSLPRWQELSLADKQGFPPICPDFVIELRSKSDRLKPLQDKMLEYLESGLRLGWLIDLKQQQVEIYRPNLAVEIVSIPTSLSGETVLPGFGLPLD